MKVHKTTAVGRSVYTKRYEYTRVCSRCDGEGIDPELPDCVCDCCENGVEELLLTEAEALLYPGVQRRDK